jgi:hypothetical protein
LDLVLERELEGVRSDLRDDANVMPRRKFLKEPREEPRRGIRGRMGEAVHSCCLCFLDGGFGTLEDRRHVLAVKGALRKRFVNLSIMRKQFLGNLHLVADEFKDIETCPEDCL